MKREREKSKEENDFKKYKKMSVTQLGCELLIACEEGNIDKVKILLENGADVNAVKNGYDESALHLAAQNGHVDVVKVLIDKGSDVNAVDYDGRTPLYCATSSIDVVKKVDSEWCRRECC